jgi:hypothetical protein
MSTDNAVPVGTDPQESGEPDSDGEEGSTICPDCGEDLPHHNCPEAHEE